MDRKIEFIAEVGSNHGSDLKCAKEYVKFAKANKADVVKFQCIKKAQLFSPRILKDGKVIDNPAWSSIANLDFPDEWFTELQTSAIAEGIEFLATPFYLDAVLQLDRVGVKRYKIASGDITFIPLLKTIGEIGKPVILSTGASSLSEIETAVSVLRDAGSSDITLMHCVANYPPIWAEMNLRAITTLQSEFGLPVGISDHTPGNMVPIASVTLGAIMIEKHVTFDRTLQGPDHPYAMLFSEFQEMVDYIRNLECALGNGLKEATLTESEKLYRLRRGTYDPETFEPNNNPNGIWLRPYH